MNREEAVYELLLMKRNYGQNTIQDAALDIAIEALKQPPEWKDASKRPPKEGRYLVWGFNSFRYWQTRIATWFNNTGWDTKVKYWRELPEPPEEVR